MTTAIKPKSKGQGFASFSPEKRREVAGKGGKIAHELGRAHTWTREEAQAAGRKGGKASRKRGPHRRKAE